jgi:hypothetical protein
VPKLRELQRRFAAALFADGCEALADIRPGDSDGAARVGIYRQQLHAGFARTLALEFPVIERLVGGKYFQGLALQFQAAHPSRAGDLHWIGAPFAAFLQARYHGGPYEYFADVALLEWALQECLIAPAAPAFDPHALRGVDPADYAQLRFELHPACRLVSSPYPVLDIWRANQPGSAATQTIDLASAMTRVLVQRPRHGVEFHALSTAEFTFLEALARDFCLGAALEAAQVIDAAFDLGLVLRRFVVLGALRARRRAQPGGHLQVAVAPTASGARSS